MIASAAAVFYIACFSAFPNAVASDPYLGAAEVFRFSFENEGTYEYDGDKDYDGQPDDWTRRKGPGFPHYVEVSIDRSLASHGRQSLHVQANGGQVAMYSPINDLVGAIDPHYSYSFRGRIRTQRLQHDAALVSLSFLNHKRERVQRFLTQPVSGTHHEWVEVTLGPLQPLPEVRFVVIGCHLAHDGKKDFQGDAWFDDLTLGRLPRLSLLSNFATHFKEGGRPIEVKAAISGLDEGHQYQLRLEMENADGQVLAQKTIPCDTSDKWVTDNGVNEIGSGPESTQAATPFRKVWGLTPQEHGFYRVRAALEQDGSVILHHETSFAVMDLMSTRRRKEGEFGWVVTRGIKDLKSSDLGLVASEAGINWLKLPLWESATADDSQQGAAASELLETLTRLHIAPVGLLNDPPEKLRSQFAHNWRGVSEIFSMPLEFWSPFLEPVVARYASSVRHWQLGSDADQSFQGLNRPEELLARIKREFDRIGRDTNVGIHWDWRTPVPRSLDIPRTFLSFCSESSLPERELTEQLKERTVPRLPHWVVLKPLPESGAAIEKRATDLAKRMLAAKVGRADAIFAWDVFDTEYGLLHRDGSPKPLFLPWRTTSLSLQGAEYLGSLQLGGGSTNYAFTRDGEAYLFIWNDKGATEEIALGEHVTVSDLWGRRKPLRIDPATRRRVVDVGPVPVILFGCSDALVRWRLGVRFEQGRVRSEYGGHQETLLGTNTFPQGVSGTVSLVLPRDWEVEPWSWTLSVAKGEPFRLPMILTLPSDASLGIQTIQVDFDIVADRRYQFRVERSYQVGLGDLTVEVMDRRLEDGRLEIEQVITNRTDPLETLDFRCHLFVPNHRRQRQLVTRLGHDKDRKFYYIPDADQLRGKEVRLRAEQVDGRRVLNKRWIIGETWDSKTEPSENVSNQTTRRDH